MQAESDSRPAQPWAAASLCWPCTREQGGGAVQQQQQQQQARPGVVRSIGQCLRTILPHLPLVSHPSVWQAAPPPTPKRACDSLAGPHFSLSIRIPFLHPAHPSRLSSPPRLAFWRAAHDHALGLLLRYQRQPTVIVYTLLYFTTIAAKEYCNGTINNTTTYSTRV